MHRPRPHPLDGPGLVFRQDVQASFPQGAQVSFRQVVPGGDRVSWRRHVPEQRPPTPESLEVLGILLGLIAMMVAGFFLNRARWELWWVFGAYAVCLKNIYANMLIPGSDVESVQMRSDSTINSLSPEGSY